MCDAETAPGGPALRHALRRDATRAHDTTGGAHIARVAALSTAIKEGHSERDRSRTR